MDFIKRSKGSVVMKKKISPLLKKMTFLDAPLI